jgi:hypothetical protein
VRPRVFIALNGFGFTASGGIDNREPLALNAPQSGQVTLASDATTNFDADACAVSDASASCLCHEYRPYFCRLLLGLW